MTDRCVSSYLALAKLIFLDVRKILKTSFLSKSHADVYYRSLGDLRSRNPLLSRSVDLKRNFAKSGSVSSLVSGISISGGELVVRCMEIRSSSSCS